MVSDNRAGARAAVEHLIAHGHRRIGWIGDRAGLHTADERLRGHRDALAAHGLEADPRLVHHAAAAGATDPAEVAGAWLRGPDPPSAIFTAQNLVTAAVVRALHALGAQRAMAHVGFDDVAFGDLIEPAITVVAQDPRGIGVRAARLLFERLDGCDGPSRSVVVPAGSSPRRGDPGSRGRALADLDAAAQDVRRAAARGVPGTSPPWRPSSSRGIQASGKTRFFRDRFLDTHVRISRDLLRTEHRERRFLELCLDTRQPFVVDKTNATPGHRRPYVEAARAAGFAVVAYALHVATDEALARNALRAQRRRVPYRAIVGHAGGADRTRAGGGVRRLVARARRRRGRLDRRAGGAGGGGASAAGLDELKAVAAGGRGIRPQVTRSAQGDRLVDMGGAVRAGKPDPVRAEALALAIEVADLDGEMVDPPLGARRQPVLAGTGER